MISPDKVVQQQLLLIEVLIFNLPRGRSPLSSLHPTAIDSQDSSIKLPSARHFVKFHRDDAIRVIRGSERGITIFI